MKKMVVTLALVCLVVANFSGCGIPEDKEQPQNEDANLAEEVAPNENYESYEAIYNDYVQRLKNATPVLIKEYEQEAKVNNGGLQGLAQIANSKIAELADITTEGGMEMADFVMTKGSGNYDEYREWYTKLNEIYEEEASKIYDVYLNPTEK